MNGRALLIYSRIVRLSPPPAGGEHLAGAEVCPGGGTEVLHHLQPSDQLLQRPDTTQQVKGAVGVLPADGQQEQQAPDVAAGPERDHSDRPGSSGFKAWLLLSLPQIGSRSRLGTPGLFGDLPPFRIYVCLRLRNGPKIPHLFRPIFRSFHTGYPPSDRPPAPPPATRETGWRAPHTPLCSPPPRPRCSSNGRTAGGVIRQQVERDDIGHHVDLNVVMVAVGPLRPAALIQCR